MNKQIRLRRGGWWYESKEKSLLVSPIIAGHNDKPVGGVRGCGVYA
jgi:hypothetical protein